MKVIWKKHCIKKQKNLIFHLKIDFYGWNNIFFMYNKVFSDRSELDLTDGTIRVQNFLFSQKSWWKNCWKLSKSLRCGKAHSFPTYQRYWFQLLIAQNGKLNEDCVKISGPYLLYFLRNKPSKSFTVGPVYRFKRFSQL